jgi:transcription elongation GreA/GreB family factor
MAMVNKTLLLGELLRVIEDDIANSKRLLEATQRLVNDAPGAMQSHSDTSRFQGGILANKQGGQLQEKQDALRSLNIFASSYKDVRSVKIELGAIFTLREDGTQDNFFLLPYGGGQEVIFNGEKYSVITFKSPLTSQLLGKKVGDRVRMTRGGMRVIDVVKIS